jgi:hypothetical protein
MKERRRKDEFTKALFSFLVIVSSLSKTIIFVEGWDGGRQGHSHDRHPTPHHHGRQPYG